MNYIKGDFFIVPNREALIGLDPQTQVLFLWICARADDRGICFPSISNLQKTTGMSRPTVVDRIKKLESIGFIQKTSGNEKLSNSYQVCLVKEVNYPSKPPLLPLVKEVNSNNTTVNENHITILRESFLKEEKWNEWLKYRKSIKKSMTDKTMEMQLKFLKENKDDCEEIINQSIRNGWAGLFPIKNKRTKTMTVISGERVTNIN